MTERETNRASDAASERQLQALLADLWGHAETLVRQEVALARTELEARSNDAKAGLQRAAIAVGLLHAAYLTTLAALVLVLARRLEPWLASLIIAVAASAGAALFLSSGRRKLERAVESPRDRKLAHASAAHRAHP